MNGERQLLAGILQEALDSFSRTCPSPTPRDHQRSRDAEAWIFSDDRSSPFTFRSVCDVLDLDAGRIRDLLVRWRHAHPLPSSSTPAAGRRVATR